jgi:hypothetical protein
MAANPDKRALQDNGTVFSNPVSKGAMTIQTPPDQRR